jgi:hypothetical protein
MANIVPKLNLNRTPSTVTNNSMVFAKNIRVDVDGSIHKDYSIESLQLVGNVFHDNLLTRIIADFKSQETSDESGVIVYYLNLIQTAIKGLNSNFYSVKQVIPDNKSFYVLLTVGVSNMKSIIVRFNEEDDLFHPCNCNWSYNGGTITGSVINNLLGETILIIAEKKDSKDIPLKSINLSKSTYNDDESIYTQTPKIPITNLIYTGDFKFSIPNGVYQFFVRYKIRDNFYTNWFPASKELFAGNKHITHTIFGTLGYHVSNINSDNSFIFIIQHLLNDNCKNFENFQIGFIVSNDGAIKGRAWKHFSFNTSRINFDYKASEAEEIEITDFTKPIFNVYNVGNVCSFKNKLYLSNYKETDFNQELQDYADKVKLDIVYKSQDINTPTNSIVYNNNICILNSSDNIVGLWISYAGNKTLNELIQPTITEVIYNAIKATSNYDKTTECYYHIGGGLASASTGIYLNITRKTFNVKKPTKIILDDYYGDDNSYNIKYEGETEEEQNDSLTTAISNFSWYFAAFYNFGYIDKNSYDFYSDGTNNSSNYFKAENYFYKKDELLQDMGILITDEKYDERDNKTFDELYINVFISPSLMQNDIIPVVNNTTLIPYQIYNFYIHYVKETGEITNGYKIDEVEIENKNNSCDTIIYPEFNNIQIPNGYVACFFSIAHVKNQTSTIYNITDGDSYTKDGNCFELNTRLFNYNSNPKVYMKNNTSDNDISADGTYYNSTDTTYCRYFGAEGVITIRKSSVNDPIINVLNDKKIFIVNNYTNVDETNLELIKCTPYINSDNWTNYNNYNLLGYVCAIYPLARKNTTKIYTDGSSIFNKSNKVEIINNLNLVEYNKYHETDSNRNTNYIGDLTIATTNETLIYSNFNLNYIELSEEFKPKYTTCYDWSESDTNRNLHKSITKFFNLFASQSLALVYKLDSTYYNYTRKTYNVYNKNDIYKFDNTIRSSKLAGDEDKLSIFEFDADDYYNIPTNRGKIVNLVSIGDAILVHTRDSMFKFTGSNTLQSNTGEIQQAETDVFQTGVNEVFGSDFGFAGLQNKDNAITTEAGYIFYDNDSKIIYMYSGNGQIVKLSDSIEKLFRYDTITNVNFANDYYNNRFFACLHFKNGVVTLSYNFNQESKSFVSVHDFGFTRAFNTKTKCYFITNPMLSITNNICRIDKSSYGIYRHLNIDDKIYPYNSKTIRKSYIDSNNTSKSVSTRMFDSIIDIIENTNYENIKTLNYINWNCSIVNDEFPIYSDNTKHFNALASSDEKYPCKTITVYTDTCSTNKLDCTNISNDKNITDINTSPYYQYPRYNQGFWTLNYFRNVLNTNDNFKYLDTNYDNRLNAVYRSDNNSLIEGKYFVTRFTFDNDSDFKLETINFNYDTKL